MVPGLRFRCDAIVVDVVGLTRKDPGDYQPRPDRSDRPSFYE